MTTTLAVPAKITKSVQPPPTKAETIQALAVRRIKKIETARILQQDEIDALDKSIDAEILSAFEATRKNLEGKLNHGYCSYDRQTKRCGAVSGISVSFNIDNPHAALVKMIQKRETLRRTFPALESLYEAQQIIRRQMQGIQPNRVVAMLSDESTIKALDSFLAKLDGEQTRVTA